ncbi:hypothetical protein BaRGS_00002056 [Batillaria attramentaria]|uniref:guanylate kinase n=1 Tax=Batillaria attramentaria TaxID=370345 RepID=A0ABD0M5E5_9CAEN
MASLIQPVVISGPSGSGKSTLLERLFKEFPDCFSFSVSHTTRKPRPGEEHGKHYYYVTREEFDQLIKDSGFLEHAEFSGNKYGTSKKSVQEIMASGRLCFLDVEINGVKSIKAADMKPRPRFIFVQPPSLEALKARLQGRGTETEESLQKRLATAQEALDYAKQPGSYDHVIINDDLDVAYEKLKGILIADITEIQKAKLKAQK